jgi:hypothetical protein
MPCARDFQKSIDSEKLLCIMRTSSLTQRLLFKRTNKQLISVGAWFFGGFLIFGLKNDFKKLVATYTKSKRIMSMIHFE